MQWARAALIRIVRDFVQVAVGSWTADGFGVERFVENQVPVGRAGLDDGDVVCNGGAGGRWRGRRATVGRRGTGDGRLAIVPVRGAERFGVVGGSRWFAVGYGGLLTTLASAAAPAASTATSATAPPGFAFLRAAALALALRGQVKLVAGLGMVVSVVVRVDGGAVGLVDPRLLAGVIKRRRLGAGGLGALFGRMALDLLEAVAPAAPAATTPATASASPASLTTLASLTTIGGLRFSVVCQRFAGRHTGGRLAVRGAIALLTARLTAIVTPPASASTARCAVAIVRATPARTGIGRSTGRYRTWPAFVDIRQLFFDVKLTGGLEDGRPWQAALGQWRVFLAVAGFLACFHGFLVLAEAQAVFHLLVLGGRAAPRRF